VRAYARMGGQSILLGIVGAGASTGILLLRNRLPVPLLAVLSHAALTSIVLSVASSDALASRTPWLLGKVCIFRP
jgi:hypothetical protein